MAARWSGFSIKRLSHVPTSGRSVIGHSIDWTNNVETTPHYEALSRFPSWFKNRFQARSGHWSRKAIQSSLLILRNPIHGFIQGACRRGRYFEVCAGGDAVEGQQSADLIPAGATVAQEDSLPACDRAGAVPSNVALRLQGARRGRGRVSTGSWVHHLAGFSYGLDRWNGSLCADSGGWRFRHGLEVRNGNFDVHARRGKDVYAQRGKQGETRRLVISVVRISSASRTRKIIDILLKVVSENDPFWLDSAVRHTETHFRFGLSLCENGVLEFRGLM